MIVVDRVVVVLKAGLVEQVKVMREDGGSTGTFIYLHSCYIYRFVSRSEPMAKQSYAKDFKSANQFPQRPAGMRVPGCLCVSSHDV